MKANYVKQCKYLFSIYLLLLFFSYPTSSQTKWYKYPGNPVFQPGKSGEWDKAKYANTVLFEDGQYHMWYKGWSDDEPGFIGIGYATSLDGIRWQKHEANPLVFKCEGTSWDTTLLLFDIIKRDSMYWMWYAGKDKKTNMENIGFAWSEDGLSWTRHPEPVLKPGKDDEWDAAGINGAKVHFDGIRYHMWYSGYDNVYWFRRIGYATSDDGIHWKKHPANPVLDVGKPGTWDEKWIGIYSVHFNGSYYEMWFDGFDNITTQVGYATSVDGINWIKSSDNPVLPVGELGTWDTWIARIPAVVNHDSIYRMWYYGHNYTRGSIGYATTSVNEAKAWDTATINKPQKIFKVQIFNRTEYINVDSLTGILPELSGIELINACNKLALAYSLNDSKKSLEFSEKALELSDKENYPEGKAMALYSIGNSQYIQDNYADALASQLLALWLFDSLDMHFELGNLLSQIAGIHSYAGSHDLACSNYKQALDVFEILNDTGFIMNSLMYLGGSYLEYGDTASAIKAFQRSFSLAKSIQNNGIQGECYESMGLCYSGSNLDSAIYYFNEANTIWNTTGPRWHKAYNFLITAEAYLAAGPEYYEDAWRYFDKCFPRIGKSLKVRAHFGVAEMEFNSGRYDICKIFLDNSLKDCQRLLEKQDYRMFASLNEKLEVEIDLKLYMEKIYRLYYRLDTALHNKDLAFTHFILASQWKDSIYSEQNRKKTAMMQGTYETESAQNQIALLEKDNEVKNLTLKKTRIYLVGLGTLVLIIFLGAILFIRNRKIRAQYAIELEQVKTEKLQELDHLKSRFFANISHEFRTPLTLIMRPLEKLLSKTHDETDKKELTIARKYAQSLQSLINNLLSLSRLESGKMQLRAKEINLIKLVNGYFQAFESLAIQRKITLKFSTKNEEIHTFIDKEKFEQVLNNLLSNAFKFTGEGGRIEIAVKEKNTKPIAGNGKYAEIKVTDTGQGIPPEHIDHIFDRFYQVESDDNSYYEGTGIGLALTKELVELHHGVINVESEAGKGSAFTILLPLGKEHLKPEEIGIDKPDGISSNTFSPVLPDFQENSITNEKSVPENNNNQSILLIVDDNTDMRAYIRENFENEFRIIEAIDGADGYEKSNEHIPDIIISDVMMPNMDGNEFCIKVKLNERTSHIPVILLTARASQESRIEGLETGADDFLTKPFDPQELIVRVNNLIEQRKKLKSIFLNSIDANGKFSDSGITSMDKKFMDKAIEIIKQHLSDSEFSVEEFGIIVGMSRSQLHRKLRALVGQSASEFIRTLRLNVASKLLAGKTGNVAEIAFEVGFNNLSWFSKCFKQQFGILPSEYSNQNKKS